MKGKEMEGYGGPSRDGGERVCRRLCGGVGNSGATTVHKRRWCPQETVTGRDGGIERSIGCGGRHTKEGGGRAGRRASVRVAAAAGAR
jgi:hypothetical protein